MTDAFVPVRPPFEDDGNANWLAVARHDGPLLGLAAGQFLAFIERIDHDKPTRTRKRLGEGGQRVEGLAPRVHVFGAVRGRLCAPFGEAPQHGRDRALAVDVSVDHLRKVPENALEASLAHLQHDWPGRLELIQPPKPTEPGSRWFLAVGVQPDGSVDRFLIADSLDMRRTIGKQFPGGVSNAPVDASPAATSEGSIRTKCIVLAVDAGFTAAMFRSGMTLAQVQSARKYAAGGYYSAAELKYQRMIPELDFMGPNDLNADAYSGAFELCMNVFHIVYEEGSVGSVWVPGPENANINLGNGIRFPYGISLTAFRHQHPGAICNDLKTTTVCKFDPAPEEVCVTAFESCIAPMTFAFRSNSLIGFVATYSEVDWRKLMKATEAVYGPGQPSNIVATSTNSARNEIVWWRLPLGAFGFVHFTTPGVGGNSGWRVICGRFQPRRAAAQFCHGRHGKSRLRGLSLSERWSEDRCGDQVSGRCLHG